MKRILLFCSMLFIAVISYASEQNRICAASADSKPLQQLSRATDDEQWETLGTGLWRDPFWTNNDHTQLEYYTGVQRSVENVNRFRFWISYDQFAYVDIIAPDHVVLYKYTHTSADGQPITVAQDCPENSLSGSYYGQLAGYEITFPDNAFLCCDDGTDNYHSFEMNPASLTMPEGFDNPNFHGYGVYVGVTGFNGELTKMPVQWLSQDNKDTFVSFIDNLQMADGTLLHYGVHNAINDMVRVYPSNLWNAILITVTDGLDHGSLDIFPQFSTSDEYAHFVATLTSGARVQGITLQSYAIGLMGDDVEDENQFRDNLKCLASKENNILTVSNKDELQQRLNELLEKINGLKEERTISIRVPMLSDGERYRFTLDYCRNDATSSQLWFEGIFNSEYMLFENCTYNGFTSSAGNLIGVRKDGANFKISVSDCRDLEGDMLELQKDGVDQWQWHTTRPHWKHNEQNVMPDGVDIMDSYSSVALMLAIDCSNSLGDMFPMVKSAAASFVSSLIDNTGSVEVIDAEQSTFDITDPTVEVFDMQGRRVTNPAAGLYIYRKDSQTRKLIVR